MENVFRNHLRHLKRFHAFIITEIKLKVDVQIMKLGGYILRIDFLKIIKQRRGKMYQKFYSKLIKCLGKYFSIKIGTRISQ